MCGVLAALFVGAVVFAGTIFYFTSLTPGCYIIMVVMEFLNIFAFYVLHKLAGWIFDSEWFGRHMYHKAKGDIPDGHAE